MTDFRLKTRFFCLYHGQKVLKIDDSNSTYTVEMFKYDSSADDSFLELLDIDTLTQDQAMSFGCEIEDEESVMRYIKEYGEESYREYFIDHLAQYQEAVDYLREKGYAMPFGKKSVQELMDDGFLKLKSNSTKENTQVTC